MVRSVVGYLVDAAAVQVDVDTLKFTYPDGRPAVVSPGGGTTMRVDVEGLGDTVPQPGTGLLHYDVGAGWQSTAMDVVAENSYEAVFPPADCPGEVLYYVSAEDVDGESYTDPWSAPATHYTAVATYGQTVFWENTFDTNPGWTTEDLWEFGEPVGGGGEYGFADPFGGYTGLKAYGYNLYGDYQNDLPERNLTSTPIDCTGRFGVSMRFQRWLGVEQPSYDRAYVRISNNGSDWATVWSNTSEVTDSEWTLQEYDISTFADDQPTVYLRWTMGETDGGWRYCGWNIDDVQLISTDCESPCAADITGDGQVDVLDLLEVLGQWGTSGSADITGNGVVDVLDLLEVLSAWGPCE